MLHTLVQKKLIHLESLLFLKKRLPVEAPSAEAMLSQVPFAIDSMTFEQWLQFIFLPQMRLLIEKSLPLPNEMGLAPMAEQVWGMDPNLSELVKAFQSFDALFMRPQAHSDEYDDTLSVEHSTVSDEEVPPKLVILYEDDDIVAIHKPAGLLVHRTYLARKERFFAMQLLRDQVGCHVYPVHRLDRPTSGILLFAKSSEMARQLCEQFEGHSIEKHYLAVVRGNMNEADRLDYPLKKELDALGDKNVDANKLAQDAVTDYQPLLNAEIPYASGRYSTSRYALVYLMPLTGRKHQLRRHMAHLRHPIIGDTTHGDGKQNKFFREHFNVNRLWLIAKKLCFDHPRTGERMVLETELDPEWLPLFHGLGWSEEALSQDEGYLI